ncbi:2'-5' RNA ligase family protein [Streptomyces lavendulae]|uniref:2'-5' RNA ligase family protein n=1 Tax=Streptomyces lavendulae TaxID=1914 RepID=UPI0033EB0D19
MHLLSDPGTFPPTPPPSVSDLDAIAEHDWAAFDAVDEMINHWDRPGWSDSTRAYYWMITVPPEAPLVSQAQDCQQQLSHLGFDEIAEDGLHLTLARVGLVGEVNSGQLDHLVSTATESLPAAFSLVAVPLTASRGALRYSVGPWNPVLELHAALSLAGLQIGLPPRKPTGLLRPHIGIAYSNRRRSSDPVREALVPLRQMPPVSLTISDVHLVELRRERRAYQWRVVHTLPLRPQLR